MCVLYRPVKHSLYLSKQQLIIASWIITCYWSWRAFSPDNVLTFWFHFELINSNIESLGWKIFADRHSIRANGGHWVYKIPSNPSWGALLFNLYILLAFWIFQLILIFSSINLFDCATCISQFTDLFSDRWCCNHWLNQNLTN